MNVSFLASDLGKWDGLEGAPETLVLPFFADERPLRGAAGLCDWRLCGRLSRLLQASRVTGAWGEATLFSSTIRGNPRLPFARLLLVGLGASKSFDDEGARSAARLIADKVARLQPTSRYALVPPGRSTGRLSARRALEIYLDEANTSQEIVIVESMAGQKEAGDLTRQK